MMTEVPRIVRLNNDNNSIYKFTEFIAAIDAFRPQTDCHLYLAHFTSMDMHTS
jgi:hypothetical protein